MLLLLHVSTSAAAKIRATVTSFVITTVSSTVSAAANTTLYNNYNNDHIHEFPGPGPFEFYPYYSALYGIFNPDYDWPTAADGVDTFYYGQNYAWTYVDCQNICEQVSFSSYKILNLYI